MQKTPYRDFIIKHSPTPFNLLTVLKVRRELREEQKRAPLAGDKTPEEFTKNKNLDKPSVYNMVLQYMPYLRDYQSGLLSKAAGQATRPCLSSVLIISLCLYL